jgi:hypothetical protein
MHLQMQLQHAWQLSREQPCPPGIKIGGHLCDSVSLCRGRAFGGQHSPIVELIEARWHADFCQLSDASEMKRVTHIPGSQKNFPSRFFVIVLASYFSVLLWVVDAPDTIHCPQRQQACYAELFGYVVAQSMRAIFRQVSVSANKTRHVWNGSNSPSASLVKHSSNFGHAAEMGRGLHGSMR